MECAVYDTYVTKRDGKTMHFDVIVDSSTPHEKALEYGKEYLKDAGQEGQKMTQEECQFCHVQEAPKIVEESIQQNGYFIQKMEGCPEKIKLFRFYFFFQLVWPNWFITRLVINI
jgi:hypothetical protein